LITPELKKEVFLLHSKIQLFEPEFVRLEIFNDTSIGRKESEEIVNTIGKLTTFRRVLLLMVVPDHATILPGAREYSASVEGTRYSSAEAIVTNNMAQTILANIYLQFNKPVVTSKAFKNEQNALEWLFSLKESELKKQAGENS
jgi:hypothetical protein